MCLCSVVLATVTMSFSPRPLGPPGSSSVQEQRARWQRKFSRTAKEMLQTEQRYCQQLELVTTVRSAACSGKLWPACVLNPVGDGQHGDGFMGDLKAGYLVWDHFVQHHLMCDCTVILSCLKYRINT